MPAVISDSVLDVTCCEGDLRCVSMRLAAWHEPVDALGAFADEPYAALLHSGGGWCYLLRQPDVVNVLDAGSPKEALGALLGSAEPARCKVPPFQGGVVGLAAYELSARLEASAPQARDFDWPDLILARYPALVAFHAGACRVVVIGRGADATRASQAAERALSWLNLPAPTPQLDGSLAQARLITPAPEHATAVAKTVRRIAAGEIFQANLARCWGGMLASGRRPLDLFWRLAQTSPAPYAAYLRLPGRAVVSNSPERFLSVRAGEGGLWAESWPIKGTRPRSSDAGVDAANARELRASAKDRAENLMIVDLMRNDLSRTCAPGTICVPELAALRSYANVHHLVSQVRGRLAPGRTAWDAFLAAFPPGSITGAPKLQAMKVIADHEPPRGPYCGSLFWAGFDGTLEANVLIRTVALVEEADGWRFETRAGGGIVADSDPAAEVAETEHKISAILGALA